ncbi:MAG: hypothetical protein JWP91_3109 [Fibrobacteres bacterium]|nr:hypothetical protein [Fibrobacterota bacterium]
MNRFHTIAFAATAAALVASCSRLNSTKTAPISAGQQESKAEAKLCKNMTEKNAAVRDYPTITPETSLDQVKTANKDLEEAVRNVQSESRNVNDPGVLEIQAAYQKLLNTVNNVPGGRATVGDAADSVQNDARQLQQAWNQVYRNLECGA